MPTNSSSTKTELRLKSCRWNYVSSLWQPYFVPSEPFGITPSRADQSSAPLCWIHCLRIRLWSFVCNCRVPTSALGDLCTTASWERRLSFLRTVYNFLISFFLVLYSLLSLPSQDRFIAAAEINITDWIVSMAKCFFNWAMLKCADFVCLF